MPTYEYQCGACGHRMEAFQKMSEEPLKDCPECHKDQLEKLISASGFQLKGGGWYLTDYSSKNKKSGSDSSNKASPAKEKTDSSSSSGTTDK